MDVGLNAEQLSLRATVRDILRTECPSEAARQALTDPDRWRPLWKTIVDLGWTELASPGAPAEGDYGPVELAVVLEECGAALAPIPLLSSIGLAAGALRGISTEGALTRCSPTSPAVRSPPWRCTRPVTGCPVRRRLCTVGGYAAARWPSPTCHAPS